MNGVTSIESVLRHDASVVSIELCSEACEQQAFIFFICTTIDPHTFIDLRTLERFCQQSLRWAKTERIA